MSSRHTLFLLQNPKTQTRIINLMRVFGFMGFDVVKMLNDHYLFALINECLNLKQKIVRLFMFCFVHRFA